MKKIENSIKNELINPLGGVSINIGEIALDSVLEDSVLKEIPIIGTIASICKVGMNIKDRYFAKKILRFLEAVKNKGTDDEFYNDFREKMKDKEYAQKIVERIVIIIDDMKEETSAVYLAALFRAYIDKYITFTEFKRFSHYIDEYEYLDFEFLRMLDNRIMQEVDFAEENTTTNESHTFRFIQLGYVTVKNVYGFTYGKSEVKSIYSITEIGTKFLNAIQSTY